MHRIRERTISIDTDGPALVLRARAAAAAAAFGLHVTYRWTDTDAGLHLHLAVEPDGRWPTVLARLGLRFGLPTDIHHVTWYGCGPGEAYPDSRKAARIGRYMSTVDELQTPYVRPQENGARIDVRRASLTNNGGTGLRIGGDPTFMLTARRWTSEHLEAARHRTDLIPGDRVWVNTDLTQHGLGSASCGPAVLPGYQLLARPASLELTFTPLPARGMR